MSIKKKRAAFSMSSVAVYRHFYNIGIWKIEVFFKTCKSFLNLIGECHSLSYDALTAHVVAIVFTRYMMLALEQRKDEDPRTLGEIFFYMYDELADIRFSESFKRMQRRAFLSFLPARILICLAMKLL